MSSIFEQFFNKNKDQKTPGRIIYKNNEPTDSDILKIKATVYGTVQGVGFRFTTVHLAKQLNVNGFVRNEPDGTVYVEANGDKENMKQFIEELAKGPSPNARVTKVEIEYDSSMTNYNGFSERY